MIIRAAAPWSAIVLAGALALAGAPVSARAHDAPAPSPTSAVSRGASLAVIRTAPDFALVDLQGRSVTLAGERGRVVLIAFIYTACPGACPLLTQRMSVLQRSLQEAGLLPGRVRLLSVTVDPERDTPAALAAYAQGFKPHADGWRFLRASPERPQPTLLAYDEWTRRLPSGEVDHPARLHLVDARGRVREIYSLDFFDERQAAADIRALLAER